MARFSVRWFQSVPLKCDLLYVKVLYFPRRAAKSNFVQAAMSKGSVISTLRSSIHISFAVSENPLVPKVHLPFGSTSTTFTVSVASANAR